MEGDTFAENMLKYTPQKNNTQEQFRRNAKTSYKFGARKSHVP